MEPISKFPRRIVAPIAEWLDRGGFEKTAIALGCLFLFAVILTAIVLFVGDVLGLEIFGSGTGCPRENLDSSNVGASPEAVHEATANLRLRRDEIPSRDRCLP